MEFKDLGINEKILQALTEQGYEKPTPIQEQAIPTLLKHNDLIGLAQTGTGKTAAFAVPTLQNLKEKAFDRNGKRKIRALVLTPTRELAIQIQENFEMYGKYMDLRSTVVFGGVAQRYQVKALRNGVDTLIATPGRLEDLMSQGYIDLSKIEIFILDEADRMLDMGFINDVKRIIKKLPKKKQTLLFSATMPSEISSIAEMLLNNPTTVAVTPVSSTVETVEQSVYYVDQRNKTQLLIDVLENKSFDSVLVFTRTKRGADRVARDLCRSNINAVAIHGDKSQGARQRALSGFKDGTINVMVATDIAARGIDINELKYVVNYELPEVPETYVHRIGRTGRAGFSGAAISFCNFEEIPLLKDIEHVIQMRVPVIKSHNYPLLDKTIKDGKISKKKKAKLERIKAEESKTKKKPMKQRDSKSKGKPKKKEKELNGPYDWSNHASKKAKKQSQNGKKPSESRARTKNQEQKTTNRRKKSA
ncbi:DEAD/DEAH box helicase [Erysipelothrix rhusiopathiae]|uniref:DEAD/DEAH box helicase n=1 Tax=Erysipelothrix rhusiopathiae TaxID=1648 RepID=UPI000F43597C|nr:DEAD/DEAH box helicase [Erysipelothrix rhusiopathiae]AYV34507.1 DEAD/DEAH box helicase [Erysipelothrix rhusiopathiae]MDE8081111.1 DEAD/DEAH box helicase [Erysipelothrix rhusiopathiae]MDE8314469.1 DEAD/DEAH box helicase [Erysipelothrix rhusiopathiae]MDE8329323.1 DEAD/DEAH box helicase [Erysipelothrix rhusiopathiae]MDE8333144.1 DEAD/DEAH box helicase [Erysipelothrix rhusiopathiae]